MLKLESPNRSRRTVAIEKELLAGIKGDVNFVVNLALEHWITHHQGAKLAVNGVDND